MDLISTKKVTCEPGATVTDHDTMKSFVVKCVDDKGVWRIALKDEESGEVLMFSSPAAVSMAHCLLELAAFIKDRG